MAETPLPSRYAIAIDLVDREAIVPIAWCYLHNAVRDHHIETERCDVPRSLLVRLDAALPERG